MILGFYYHTPFLTKGSELFMPSYLGLFLESLLKRIDKLIIFGHLGDSTNANECNYEFNSQKVIFINLGFKTSSYHRFFFNKKILNPIRNEIAQCDALLIRGPSPLAPFFLKRFGKLTKIFYLIVGDYTKVYPRYSGIRFKQKIIKTFNYLQDLQLSNSISKCSVFTNSKVLYDKYKNISKNTIQVYTTTISDNDIFKRNDTIKNKKDFINILYSGRFDFQKGILDVLKAVHLLINENYKIKLHYVGWEDSPKLNVLKKLNSKIDKLGLNEHVIIHGKQKAGPELFGFYKMCQIFVIPSYNESFPKTIWEAFANSIPVIASKVGSIPDFTSHEKNIYLIEPKDVYNLKGAIGSLINDSDMRKKLIYNGRKLVKNITLEKQSEKLIRNIKNQLM